MAHIDALTPKKVAAIVALLSSPTIEQAATVAGVHRSTLTRWLADEAFQQALTEAEAHVIGHATRRLLTLLDRATQAIDDLLGSSNDGVKLRAALSVLEAAPRLRDLNNEELRLSKLEARLAEQQEQTTEAEKSRRERTL